MSRVRATGRAIAVVAALAGVVAIAPAGFAQQSAPLLTIDQEELFLRSAFGQRIRDDIARASAELAAENRRIETELTAEEQSLTRQRPTMSVADFRAAADAFDAKVTALRNEQDTKTRAITRANDEAQQVFFSRVATILGQIMRDRGALVILDGRTVLLAAEVVDITDTAIARIDAAIGDGLDPSMPPADPAAPASPDGETPSVDGGTAPPPSAGDGAPPPAD